MAKRYYSLFERNGAKWVRISPLAGYKDFAVRLFQNALLHYSMCGGCNERSLRVVKSRDCDDCERGTIFGNFDKLSGRARYAAIDGYPGREGLTESYDRAYDSLVVESRG